MLTFKQYLIESVIIPRLRIHKNPSNEKISDILAKSHYKELKGIVDHSNGDLHVWDSAAFPSTHGDVHPVISDKSKGTFNKETPVSALHIMDYYKVIEHGSPDTTSMHGVNLLDREKGIEHPKMQSLAKHLGFTQR